MAGTYKYSKLSQEQVMNYYATKLQVDYEFIKKYREELKSIVEKILRANDMRSDAKKQEGISDLILLAESIKDFMKKATPQTIMGRLRFINNISRELFAIKTELDTEGWVFFNQSDVNSFFKSIEVFLRAVSSEAIKHNGLLDKCINHLNQDMSTFLINNLKDNFLCFIDKENPSAFDVYYFLGACLKREADLNDQAGKKRESFCEACKKDDCLLTPCSTFEEIQRLEKGARTYGKMAEACTNIIFSLPQDKMEISKTLAKIPDAEYKKLFEYFINMQEKESLPQRQKLVGRELFLIQIIEDGLKKEMLSRLGQGGRIDYTNADHVAITIIEALYDFSGALGAKELKEFQSWMEIYEKSKEKVIQYENGSILNIKQIFEQYKKQNNLEKI